MTHSRENHEIKKLKNFEIECLEGWKGHSSTKSKQSVTVIVGNRIELNWIKLEIRFSHMPYFSFFDRM